MISEQAIGVFDSGIGGLTVVRHLQEQLPYENIIYLGDTARVPYGNKSKEIVSTYSLEITKFLISKKIKCIVIACNTASAFAFDIIREEYPSIPVFGMIETGSFYAVSKTKSKHVGIIGTSATISSQLYKQKLRELDSNIKTIAIACPLFVPIVEENLLSGEITQQIINMYLSVFKNSNIDTLILGCTHYPLLKSAIQSYLGDSIYLIDSGKAAAQFVKEKLIELNLLTSQKTDGFLHCYLTCQTPKFQEIADICISSDIDHLEHIDIETVYIRPTDSSSGL